MYTIIMDNDFDIMGRIFQRWPQMISDPYVLQKKGESQSPTMKEFTLMDGDMTPTRISSPIVLGSKIFLR